MRNPSRIESRPGRPQETNCLERGSGAESAIVREVNSCRILRKTGESGMLIFTALCPVYAPIHTHFARKSIIDVKIKGKFEVFWPFLNNAAWREGEEKSVKFGQGEMPKDRGEGAKAGHASIDPDGPDAFGCVSRPRSILIGRARLHRPSYARQPSKTSMPNIYRPRSRAKTFSASWSRDLNETGVTSDSDAAPGRKSIRKSS